MTQDRPRIIPFRDPKVNQDCRVLWWCISRCKFNCDHRREVSLVRSLLMKCTPRKRRREQLSRTCRPAFALCDFGALPAASFVPAFPPVDLPFPPAISIWTGGGLGWRNCCWRLRVCESNNIALVEEWRCCWRDYLFPEQVSWMIKSEQRQVKRCCDLSCFRECFRLDATIPFWGSHVMSCYWAL